MLSTTLDVFFRSSHTYVPPRTNSDLGVVKFHYLIENRFTLVLGSLVRFKHAFHSLKQISLLFMSTILFPRFAALHFLINGGNNSRRASKCRCWYGLLN